MRSPRDSEEASSATFFGSKISGNILLEVVQGDYWTVDKLLTNDPELLFLKGDVTDFSGRKHQNRSVYQLALGAIDCDHVDKKVEATHKKNKSHIVEQDNKLVRGMIEMIESHFHKYPNLTPKEIKEIMDQLYVEQFPKGYKEQEAKKIASDIAALHTARDAVKKARSSDCKMTSSKMTYELDREIFVIRNCEMIDERTGKRYSAYDSYKETPKWGLSERAKKLNQLVNDILEAKEENFDFAFKAFEDYIKEKAKLWVFDDKKPHNFKLPQFDFSLLKAIYRFRNHFQPRGIVTSGKHFNFEVLTEATKLLQENSETFDNDQKELYKQFILYFLYRFVPACDAQFIVKSNSNRDDHIRRLYYGNHPFDYDNPQVYFPLDELKHWAASYYSQFEIGYGWQHELYLSPDYIKDKDDFLAMRESSRLQNSCCCVM